MKRIIAGRHAVLEALRARTAGAIAVVYVADSEQRTDAEVSAEASRRRIPVEARPKDALDALAKGVRHQGVVAIAGEYPYTSLEEILVAAERPPLLVVLDQITDPQNLGAIVRTAVALGADGLVTLEHRAAPVTAAAVRASAGATEHARIARVTNLARAIETMQREGLEVVGLAGEATETLDELGHVPAGRALVVGAEGEGLRRLTRERCDRLVRIPITPVIGSLNASVALGIALHHAARVRPVREADAPRNV